ncbi:acyl-CoA thioester hydrolase/BAAT C-terminal domain-containing protein [Biostraticola tofi]|uniref:Acyl-CoA thioester hydrolase/bile acid acetyltransferase-like protein n=1 Tax=Biostraticola tofi TaxID=466109 RepID=A0A4R3Z1Q6_9GAMM|nr:acyl-CoA thioester hydrolase/BAAT C-terminal domain-containing protein [Biostraticola tofi]TCV98837.1 acyl-CoA thioester hydrolase/bile acid acetyltransferase-like protein [Biostraticola tofi]
MSIQLHVDIPDGLIDLARTIRAQGLAPGVARLTATLTHADGSLWRSTATFAVADNGELDLTSAVPLAGDWQESEPMAPVWSLRQTARPRDPALSDGIQPHHIRLQIADAAGASASTEIIQRYLAPGVIRREVRENGLSGTLFLPRTAGPHPVVIVLNGSGGGTPEQQAALLAAQGYIGFALAYFKAPGRPDYISATPLEYFKQALDWVIDELQPKAGFIAVAGHSRGGELALLLGATFPERVAAVIGYVPSAVINGTLRAGRPEEPRDATAWTWRGESLPNLWQGNPLADWHAFDHPPQPGAPIRQAPAFLTAERHPQSLAAARIPVERIAGPLLLISGTDDGFWPSTAYCERIAADLQAKSHGWPVEHVRNEGAGHAIGFPFVPTTEIARVHPVAGVVIDGGGTPLANARARCHSWRRVLAFLSAARAAHEGKL